LLPQTAVTVRKSDKAARFVSFGEHEFFEILSHKLLQRG
jgi:NAD kinase